MQAVYEFGKAPYKPLSSAKEVVWFWNEVGELLFKDLPKCRSLGQAWQRLRDTAQLLLSSVDAVLDPADPLPFLALHYQQVRTRDAARCGLHHQCTITFPLCITYVGPNQLTTFCPSCPAVCSSVRDNSLMHGFCCHIASLSC